jgi:hypothetical protein
MHSWSHHGPGPIGMLNKLIGLNALRALPQVVEDSSADRCRHDYSTAAFWRLKKPSLPDSQKIIDGNGYGNPL